MAKYFDTKLRTFTKVFHRSIIEIEDFFCRFARY